MTEHDNIDVSREQRDTLEMLRRLAIDWLRNSDDERTKALRGTVLKYIQEFEDEINRLKVHCPVCDAEMTYLSEWRLGKEPGWKDQRDEYWYCPTCHLYYRLRG